MIVRSPNPDLDRALAEILPQFPSASEDQVKGIVEKVLLSQFFTAKRMVDNLRLPLAEKSLAYGKIRLEAAFQGDSIAAEYFRRQIKGMPAESQRAGGQEKTSGV